LQPVQCRAPSEHERADILAFVRQSMKSGNLAGFHRRAIEIQAFARQVRRREIDAYGFDRRRRQSGFLGDFARDRSERRLPGFYTASNNVDQPGVFSRQVRAGTILLDEDHFVGPSVVEQGCSDIAAMKDFAQLRSTVATVEKLVFDGEATKLEESGVGGFGLQNLRFHGLARHSPIDSSA